MYFYGLLVLVAAGLAAIAIWSPRAAAPKCAALLLTALLMAGGYGALLEMLGRPKPMAVEWVADWAGGSANQEDSDATVVAMRLSEGEAIYLWLETKDAPVPRAYALPWSLEQAKQLNEAMREAEANGTKAQMRQGSRRDRATNEPLFYAEPQEALPNKRAQSQSGG